MATDYKKMYLTLFHAVEYTTTELEKGPVEDPRGLIFVLRSAMEGAEEIYLETAGDEDETE